jgi:small subunit ribosomal protein S1
MNKNSATKNNNESSQLPLSFEDLLNNHYAIKSITEGNIINVKVISFQKDYVIVDTDLKCEGLIPIKDFKKTNDSYDVKVNDTIEALIEEKEHKSGWMLLSKEKAEKIRIWNKIEYSAQNNHLITGTIVEKVKGGLQVEIGVKAFLPGSQIDLRPIKDLDSLLGKKLEFCIIKFNKKRGNIVLSRRLVLEKKRNEQRFLTLKKIKEGAILNGMVKNLTDYGAFIDLGGVDGLLHVTDISWGRLVQPHEHLKCGDIIKVKVLRYDKKLEKVSLGIKQICDDPWMISIKELQIGTRIIGKVVSITDYGVFVEIKPGIEGLIHISEISWNKRIKHPSMVVNKGEDICVVLLDIDLETKRISLGMKQTSSNPWFLLEKKYKIGTIIQGSIRNVTDFGVFVHIENGIDGLIHISDLFISNKLKHPSDFFSKNDIIKAVVLNIDIENRKFSLGANQLIQNSWNKFLDKYSVGMDTNGVIKKITNYGVFVEIADQINGLLHVSDFLQKNHCVLSQGQLVNVKINNIDIKSKHLDLSINFILPNV